MATNFIQPGRDITLTAGGTVSSGDGLLTGSMFGIALNDATSGDDLVVATEGVWTLPKTSAQAWTVGALIYWDDSVGECTTTATDNTLIGVAVAAAANPSATGTVRLNGAFTS